MQPISMPHHHPVTEAVSQIGQETLIRRPHRSDQADTSLSTYTSATGHPSRAAKASQSAICRSTPGGFVRVRRDTGVDGGSPHRHMMTLAGGTLEWSDYMPLPQGLIASGDPRRRAGPRQDAGPDPPCKVAAGGLSTCR